MTINFINFIFSKKNKLALFFSLFLVGCQMMPLSNGVERSTASAPTKTSSLHSDANETQATQPSYSEKYQSENDKLQMCQVQLDALKVVSPDQYQSMQNAFDHLMKGAAQYANLRTNISTDTQDTVDSLYRYRANLLCAHISQKLLDGLTSRGEARP